MTPYYEDDAVTIYHGDAREVLPGLSADAVIADAPYGVGVEYDRYEDSAEELTRLVNDVFPLMTAVAPVAAVFTGVRGWHAWPVPTWTLCWHVPTGAGSGPWGFTTWQPINVYGKDPSLQKGLGRFPDSVATQFGSHQMAYDTGATGHPCPKPDSVMRWLVRRVSIVPGETIVDPFMGAGGTLRAAKWLGRKSIGIDISEAYCEIAAKRVAQEVLAL